MNIGLKFQIPNEHGTYLNKILKNVNNENYIWEIEEDEVYIKDGFLFEEERYSNFDFKKIIAKEEYYAVFVNIKLYEKEDTIIINNYEDFLRSNCTLILFITDNIFVDIYSKDEEILNIIYKNALENKFSDIEYITENDYKRKMFSAYSD